MAEENGTKSNRLQSIDAFRGFDMMFIMGIASLIACICEAIGGPVADAISVQMNHPAWNGVTHHDTIFPTFLFIAGISFPFSYAKQTARGYTKGRMHLKVLYRVLMLVFLGMVYNGFFKFDFANLRCASVLARIGIAWGVAAILFMDCSRTVRIVIAPLILIAYGLVSIFVGAPDAPGMDPLSQDGCLVGYIDRLFLPGKLHRGNFDPEGILSTVPAVVTAMMGMFTGEFIRSEKVSGNKKTLYMIGCAVALAILGVLFNPVLPINKSLWSSTFVLVVGAYSLFCFAVFYWIIEVKGWKKWSVPFQVIGMNSITIYLGQRIIDFGGISKFFFGGIASKFPESVGNIILVAAYFLISWLFLWFLYKKKVFLKV